MISAFCAAAFLLAGCGGKPVTDQNEKALSTISQISELEKSMEEATKPPTPDLSVFPTADSAVKAEEEMDQRHRAFAMPHEMTPDKLMAEQLPAIQPPATEVGVEVPAAVEAAVPPAERPEMMAEAIGVREELPALPAVTLPTEIAIETTPPVEVVSPAPAPALPATLEAPAAPPEESAPARSEATAKNPPPKSKESKR